VHEIARESRREERRREENKRGKKKRRGEGERERGRAILFKHSKRTVGEQETG
jgi:hypothetical protein